MFESEISQLTRTSKRPISELPGLKIKNWSHVSHPLLRVFAAMMVVFFMVVYMEMSDWRHQLLNKGIHAEARVTAAIESKYVDKCPKVYFEFTAKNGLKYSGHGVADNESPACSLKKGDTITILYLADNPKINASELSIDANDGAIEGLALILFLILFFLLPAILPDTVRFFQHRRIYKFGQWAAAEFIYIKDGTPSTPATVFVRFNTVDGKSIETRIKFRNIWLLGVFRPGDQLNVVYKISNPKKAMLVECYIR